MTKDEWATFVMRKQLENIMKKKKEAKKDAMAQAKAEEQAS